MTATSDSGSAHSSAATRLQSLQQHLGRQGWSAVFIPSSDPHLSEYLPAHWQGREFFSGFTGSSGSLLVAVDRAALFTDSRYWEQAEKELAGSGVDLVKLDGPAMPAYAQWLAQVATQGILAVDGDVLGLAQAKQLGDTLTKMGWQLQADADPLAGCWADRPTLPAAPIFEHAAPYAATARAEKLSQLYQALQQQGATHHWISTLDDLAWLLNLRGADVEYNPVFLAHALITPNGVKLFIQADKVPAGVRAALQQDGVSIEPYEQAWSSMAQLPAQAVLLLDPKRVTWGLRQRVPQAVKVIEAINPTTLAKSRKTDAEAHFIREAMAQDGAAMARFYAWFEQALGHEDISELTVDERLTQERAARPGYVSLSFPTIAGYNANGALPHYRATPQSFAMISTRSGLVGSGLLLIDSGAQYLGGTTDITRVWAIGTPTPEQKRDFTLVLKGTMALSRARFPKGTLAPMLDAIARAPLWEHGLDFGHGTGHGVGYFLNVHEGPQSISKAIPEAHMAMQPGMITSIEPGLYRPGKWGIRIENLVLNVPRPPATSAQVGDPEYGEYLAFETLSLCPIDTRCLDLTLLRPDEIAWLNAYHAEVWQRVSPLVDGDALAWLKLRTAPI